MTEDVLSQWEAEAREYQLNGASMHPKQWNDRILTLVDLIRKKDAGIKGLFDLMDSGLLVRDISNDHKPDWSVGALAITLEVKKAYEALALTKELK